MKKLFFLAVLLVPALALGASDYSREVSPGGTIKVCIPTPPTFSLVGPDGDVAFEQYASRQPGKCAKIKTPKTITPGTYTLKASDWGNVGKVVVGSVEVVAKKEKKSGKSGKSQKSSAANASADYTRKVSPGGTIKVCIDTPPTFKLVGEDGSIAFEQYADRQPGKCAKIKTPTTLTPGTYTLKASEYKNNGQVIVGTVKVVAKKSNN